MTRARAVLVCAAVIAVAAAVAPPAHSRNNGVIRGRVLNESRGSPQAGIKVTLSSAAAGGERLTRTARTDGRGRYAFEDLPTGDERAYAVSAFYQGGFFTGAPIDQLGRSTRRTVVEGTLRIWKTISDPDAVLIRRHNLFVSPGEGGLGVIEAVTIVNTSSRAYIGRGRSLGVENARATVSFALPPQATDGRLLTESDFFGTPISGTDTGFGLTVAVPPGTRRVLFAYTLPGQAGNYELSRPALYPTLTTSVHATDGLTVDSNRLAEAGDVTIGNTRYSRWSSEDVIEAGDALQVSITAESGVSGYMVAATAGAVLAVAGLFVVAVRRNRRSSPKPPHAPAARREALVAEIAVLDLRHEAGRVGEGEWTDRRAQLKQKLADLPSKEPTR